MPLTRRALLAGLAGSSTFAAAQSFLPGLPDVGFRADNVPQRTECGIGALMPWADGLYAITYNSHKRTTGTGLGLYRIDEALKPQLIHLHNGTHANRLIHHESNQCFIGPYVIDSGGKWRFIEAFDDHQGMFYELQPLAFEGRIWGVKPVCQHLRIIPDYCAFRGLLALGGNQTSPNNDNNAVVGQPQSGIWFGKTDDLWSWERPQGWGGPWRKAMVAAGVPSDPFLFTGFERKALHLVSSNAIEMQVEIDFLGDGEWQPFENIRLSAGQYKFFPFPDAFTCHWVRLTPNGNSIVTAQFMFT